MPALPTLQEIPPLVLRKKLKKRQGDSLLKDQPPQRRRISSTHPSSRDTIKVIDTECDLIGAEYVVAHSPNHHSGNPLVMVPTPIGDDLSGWSEPIRPSVSMNETGLRGSIGRINTKKYVWGGVLLFFAFLIMVNFLLGLSTNKMAIIAKDVQPAVVIHPNSFPCKPNYPALVAVQARLAGDSSPSDQLLSSSEMAVEVGKLASEFLVRGVHGTPAPCNIAITLSNDLRQVEYVLNQLDISMTGTIERLIIADSTALTVLQERLDLSGNTIFRRLINATSTEISALEVEIQSDLTIARTLVDHCETMRPLLSTSNCQHVACCIGDDSESGILLHTFSQLNFLAHQLAAQFEEVAATLALLQAKVGHLACRDSDIGATEPDYFTKQDHADLEFGVQKLRGCRRRIASGSFFRHFDYFGSTVQPPSHL